jgi:hypothetical protein
VRAPRERVGEQGLRGAAVVEHWSESVEFGEDPVLVEPGVDAGHDLAVTAHAVV